MGYKDYLAASTRKKERYDLQKAGAKKALWGSIGATAGGLFATAITGGAAAPWAAGLIAGASTFAGGAIGRSAGGSLTQDKILLKDEASQAQKQLGAFGSENITGALKSGLTAGIGQSLSLGKEAMAAKRADPNISKEALKSIRRGKGLDIGESFVGRGVSGGKEAIGGVLEKRAIGKELMKAGEASIGTADRTLQVGEGQFITGGDRAGMVLPDGTRIGSGRTSIPRGQMAPGEITSKIGKVGVFDVDLEDVEETVSVSDILSRKKTAMSQFFEDPNNVKELGLYTGMGPEGYRPTSWRPEAGTDLREFSDKYKTFSNTEMAGIPEWRSDARDWASEIGELKSQEFQQLLSLRNRLGMSDSPQFGLSAGNMYKNKWGR